MKPKDLIRILEKAGWRVARIDGSHHIMKHTDKPGMLVIPLHNKDMKPGTLNQIVKQSGLKPVQLPKEE